MDLFSTENCEGVTNRRFYKRVGKKRARIYLFKVNLGHSYGRHIIVFKMDMLLY
uniref:Uncharacterized protein n=1 Tax=Arundo donax TaxID=35708 RepID=A0A0A8XQX8_ARUDO